MSISSQFIKQAEDAIYHHPNLIPKLFTECNVKKGFVHSRLRRYVPHRIGIEFECFGDFANLFILNNKLKWTEENDFKTHFNLIDFSQELSIGGSRKFIEPNSDIANEIRVSIQDYRQLNGLYNIMSEMAKYCTISDDCGIHIHVDLTKYSSMDQKKKAIDWFNKHLHEVESIFPKYTGTYNKRIAQRGKASWVNLSSHDTVEFRIAPLTFDYEVLIPWIIKCSKLVSRMISECHLDRKQKLPDLVSTTKRNESLNTTYGLEDLSDSDPSVEDGLELPWEISTPLSREVIRDNADLVISMLLNDLDREHVDHYFRGCDLIMNYPDGSTAIIAKSEAIRAFLDGGLSEVIRVAHVFITVNSGDYTYSGNYYLL